MKLGALSPEIHSDTISELFRKTKEYGFCQMQFNYSSVGKEQMPEFIDDALTGK